MILTFFRRATVFSLITSLAMSSPGAAVWQARAYTNLPAGGDPWPRLITARGATMQIYQPQLDQWTGNRLEAYAAVAIHGQSSNDKAYGVIWFTARTEVDKVNRLVTLDDVKLTKRNFPSLPNNGSQYEQALQACMSSLQTIPLDLLETSLSTTSAVDQQKKYQLNNEPPNIIFSGAPAVLALIDGEPALRPTGDNLQKVINTRALIIFDSSKQLYYLALMDGWMEAPRIAGPWSVAKNAPVRSLNKLKRTAEASDQNQVLGNPEQPLEQACEEGEAPAVYVSTVPAELLLTQGPPQFTPIVGTSLLYVENSGSDIFMDNFNQMFYVLIAGRWFTSNSLQKRAWSYVPGAALPSDFAEIPTYSPKASALVSVQGTPQAKEALIANQIPQTAAISRNAAKLEVRYYGTPNLKSIEGTNLQYVSNTPIPVIYVPGSGYYAVQNAVWFESSSATGPWAVATSVPSVIYTIPPSCPIHYVTYAYLYGFTSTSVYVGYTPGYYGTVVSSDDVVVYGTGWSYPPYIGGEAWVPAPYTYGVGAAFSWSTAAGWGLGFGLGMTIGSACSPWWGPVGGWGWGTATPAWGWEGYGGAAAANIYGRWGNTAYGGTRAAWAGTVNNAYTGNYAAGARAATYNAQTGVVHAGATGVADNTRVANAGNNIYADHDGNVYKASPGSGWQQHDGDGWRTWSGSGTMRSSMNSWQSARGLGDQRWSNFQSEGWGSGLRR